MNRANKNVLVVGGAGYIGSHTTLALREAGFNPVVYDNFSTGHRDACFGTTLVEGELSDRDRLVSTLRDHDIDGVIHFAALIEAGQSVVGPLPFFRNNVASTLSLLEAMQETGIRRLVFSSTAAVYGNLPDGKPLNEGLPRNPVNPYGHTKSMVETMLEATASAHGLQAIALRYFNASGADPQCRTGERHTPETHLIPLIIEAALGTRAAIKIFGTDYQTPDGTCIRDYIHVNDLATGHVAALNNLFETDLPGIRAYNLGTGTGHSVREVIDMVRRISGRDFAVLEEGRRAGDPAILVADASGANRDLGWKAKHSGIDQIVRDAWNYALSAQGESFRSTGS
ncbi:UDP-glucose 4-epimerase GalE [Amaricoccus tamworthensis]|uniref:UDP-glucose 4-epimerase GalE n=1 Tax=Amaricoccus tamworthensis TaxID=57002 RepID=UPI003C798F56